MFFWRGVVVDDVSEHAEKVGGMFQRMFWEMLGGNLATGGGPYNGHSTNAAWCKKHQIQAPNKAQWRFRQESYSSFARARRAPPASLCHPQLHARNGVEEPAQDFHVWGHVVVGGPKHFVCQIVSDLLEEDLAGGLFMFQVTVHAQLMSNTRCRHKKQWPTPEETSQDAAPSVTASTRSHPPCRMKGKSIILTHVCGKWLQHRPCSHKTVVGQHDTSL